MKTLIVIPTYNEKENIPLLTKAVLDLPITVDILVVDDSSPDGTGEIVQNLMKTQPRLHLLVRQKKEGLGRAYIAGFKWGLEKGYDIIVEMDADFSHRPLDLVKILDRMSQADFVVGSRWTSGGGTVHWSLMRKIISKGGSFYSRTILGYPLKDWTGGFNAWKRKVLEGIGLDSIQSNGYSFQIELKYKALKKGFVGVESPILFEDRRIGNSKMSMAIVLEAFYKVWKIRFQ